MTTIKELNLWVNQKIKENPQLKSQILALFDLCIQEIEDGGSIRNEIDICYCDIKELIEESK